jgi:hypothetical protein
MVIPLQSGYENFPLRIIALANALSILMYADGIYILSQLGIVVAGPYVLFCLFFEARLLRRSCVDCYYYGKRCGFGKGKLCSLFFSKGDPGKFSSRPFTWKNLIPDMLIIAAPLVGGIIALIIGFQWILLGAVVAMVFGSFMGNACIRGSFTCKHCKQRELGCLADQFFNKTRHTPVSEAHG